MFQIMNIVIVKKKAKNKINRTESFKCILFFFNLKFYLIKKFVMKIIIFLILLFGFSHEQKQTVSESNIKIKLFNSSSYDKTIRPSDTVKIQLALELQQIVDVVERSETLITSSYLFMQWKDSRLKWNSSEFNDLKYFQIPIDSIWLPDFYVINTAEKNGFLSYKHHLAFLRSEGVLVVNVGLIGKLYFLNFCLILLT